MCCAGVALRSNQFWTIIALNAFPWYAQLCSSMNAGAAATCAWIPGHAGPGVG